MQQKIILLSSICLTLFSACANKNQANSPEVMAEKTQQIKLSKAQVALAGLTFCMPQQQKVESHIRVRGNVVVLAQNQSSMHTYLPGTVESIDVLEGQRIKKGQLIAQLGSLEYVELQQNYLEQRSEYDLAKAEWERIDNLYTQKAVSLKEMQQAKNKFEMISVRKSATLARLHLMGCDVEKLVHSGSVSKTYSVYAAMDGYLYKLPISIGSRIQGNDELARIINLDRLHADLYVFEKDIHAIKEGQSVDLHFINTQFPAAKGKVEFISRAVDVEKKSILVHVVFHPSHAMILPDMQVEADFISEQVQDNVIPAAAVLRSDNHFNYFEVIEEGKDSLLFEQKISTLNELSENYFQIPKERTSKNKVVCKGLQFLEAALQKEEE